MARYYGWYSNRARGERAKKQVENPEAENPAGVQVIDVSDYEPRRLPSKKWRELIKQVWEVDPFDRPRCGAEMKLIALIDDNEVIEKILRHLELWPKEAIPARAPPKPIIPDYVIEPVPDDREYFDEVTCPQHRYPHNAAQKTLAMAAEYRKNAVTLKGQITRNLSSGSQPETNGFRKKKMPKATQANKAEKSNNRRELIFINCIPSLENAGTRRNITQTAR